MGRNVRLFCRRLSSSGKAVSEFPWLSQPLSKSRPQPIKSQSQQPITANFPVQHTQLANGLRVASQGGSGDFCTIGVAVKAGSRYEMFSPSGVTHVLEKVSYNSTASFHSKDQLLHQLEQTGGICDCQFSRDVAFYAMSVSRENIKPALQILSEVVLQPKLKQEELELAKLLVSYDLQDHEESLLRMQPDILLQDLIHRASFRGNTIGLPKFCPKENVESITVDDLRNFLKTYIVPERTVVAAAGLELGTFAPLVEECLDFSSRSYGDAKGVTLDESVAQYTGGELNVEQQIKPVSGGDNPLPELTHFMIGLESPAVTDPGFVAANVLSFLMGGGGSFSAGGPGKGMYARMYLNVLNRYHYAFHAAAQCFPYYDAGLFCVQAASPPEKSRDLCQVLVRELLQMTSSIEGEELARAKNQLKSMLVMNLETRPVQFEDIARQMLGQASHRGPEELVQMIDAVTAQEIQSVAHEMLGSKVSCAFLGRLMNVPSSRELTHAFIHGGNWPKDRIKL